MTFRVHYTLVSPDGVLHSRADDVAKPDPKQARQHVLDSFKKRIALGWSIRWNKCKRLRMK